MPVLYLHKNIVMAFSKNFYKIVTHFEMYSQQINAVKVQK